MRTPTWLVLLLAMVGWLLLGLPAPATWAQNGERVILEWSIGFSNHVHEDSWYPVRVQLESYYQRPTEARLVLTRPGSDKEPSLRLTQVIPLEPYTGGGTPPSAMAFFAVPPLEGDKSQRHELRVVHADGGDTMRYRRVEEEYEKEDGSKGIRVLWPPITEPDAKQVSVLQWDERLVITVGDAELPLDDDPGDLQFFPQRAETRDLPTEWITYESVDTVVLVNPQWEDLRQGKRWEALRTWVLSGGHLLLVTSERKDEVEASALPGFGGNTIADVATIDMLPLNLSGIPTINPVEQYSLPGPIPILKAHLDEGTDALMRGRDVETGAVVPLVTRRRRGLGLVTTYLMDPTRGALRDNPAMLHFNQDAGLLDRAYDRFRLPGGDQRPLLESAWLNGMEAHLQPRFMKDTQTIKQARPPDPWLLAAFFGAFIMVIGPLDYLVLRALDRLNWTWVTFTLSVVLFFFVAQFGTEEIKGGAPVIRQLVVLDQGVDPVYPVVRGRTYGTIFSQANAAYQVYLDQDDPAVTRLGPREERAMREFQNPNYNNYGYGYGSPPPPNDWEQQRSAGQTFRDAETDMVIQQPNDPEPVSFRGRCIRETQLPRWTTRFVRGDWMATGEEHCVLSTVGKVDLEAPQPALSVRNDGDLDFDNVIALTEYGVLHTGSGTTGFPAGTTLDLLQFAPYFGDRQRNTFPIDPDEIEKSWTDNLTPIGNGGPQVDEQITSVILATCWQRVRGTERPKQQAPNYASLALGGNYDTDDRLPQLNAWYMNIQAGVMRHLDASAVLASGGGVVIAWTGWNEDANPSRDELIRLGENQPDYHERVVARLIIWPDE